MQYLCSEQIENNLFVLVGSFIIPDLRPDEVSHMKRVTVRDMESAVAELGMYPYIHIPL